jgi:hypothetical protein
LRVEELEQPAGVRVRERVVGLLEQEKLAPAQPGGVDLRLPEHHRIFLLRLGRPHRAWGSSQAVRRPETHEIRLGRDLRVAQLVVVGARDVRDAGAPGGLDEPAHRGERLLGAGHVELAVRRDEVELRVDVPEDAVHGTSSSRGLGR